MTEPDVTEPDVTEPDADDPRVADALHALARADDLTPDELPAHLESVHQRLHRALTEE